MTPKVERLVNLTVALLEARMPMTLAEIKRRTGYYSSGDAASARRMFERDKDELRRLGVPVETRPVPHSDEYGYLIARGRYELPDVDLTGEEVAALAVAVRLTGADGTPLALAKLAARAPDPVELEAAPTTRLELSPEPVDEVAEAIVERQPLAFDYRAADGTQGRRTVDPYGVVQRRSAWYLVGRDHDRDALRAFRLDRMRSSPEPVGEPGGYEPPGDLDIAGAVQGPGDDVVEAEVAVVPRATWSLALRGGSDTGRRTDDGRAVWRLPDVAPLRDRSFLLGLGADVEVLAPESLRAAVVAALEAVSGRRGPAGGAGDHNGEVAG